MTAELYGLGALVLTLSALLLLLSVALREHRRELMEEAAADERRRIEAERAAEFARNARDEFALARARSAAAAADRTPISQYGDFVRALLERDLEEQTVSGVRRNRGERGQA